jgi:hypothetical protein
MSWFSAYAAWALAGAMKLARFDASGMNHFEVSTEGFWRSFLAAAIVAPFFGMLLILRHFDADGGGQFLHNLILEFETYAISWLVFPLVMAGFTRMQGCAQNYVAFIVAYNWCGAIQNAVYLPIAILAHAGTLSSDLANAFGLGAILWVLAYNFFVARTALQVPAGTAVGIVFIDLMLGLMLDMVSNRFL